MRAGPELKFENYESGQHRLQFSGIKKGAKISFHRHFSNLKISDATSRDEDTNSHHNKSRRNEKIFIKKMPTEGKMITHIISNVKKNRSVVTMVTYLMW